MHTIEETAVTLAPQNLEAERCVIGACLIAEAAIKSTLEIVRDRPVFYRQAHQTIWDAIVRLYKRKEPVDLLTLCNELERVGKFEEVGGAAVMMDMCDVVPTSENADFYAQIVLERYERREEIACGIGMIQRAQESAQDTMERRLEVRKWLTEREQAGGIRKRFRTVGDLWAQILEEFKNWQPVMPGSVKTGIKAFDDLAGPAHANWLTILTGRPGMGKTGLSINWAQHIAMVHGPCLYVTLEVSREELSKRILSPASNVDTKVLLDGPSNEDALFDVCRAVARAIAEHGSVPLAIEEGPLDVAGIRRSALDAKSEFGGLAAIFVDRVEKVGDVIKAAAKGDHEKRNALGYVSGALHEFAHELQIPVFLLAQLSRKCEDRDNKRPMLADLRDSGSLEENAQRVVAVYRDEYYCDKCKNQRVVCDRHEPNRAELIVLKNQGRDGRVPIAFDRRLVRFSDLPTAPSQQPLDFGDEVPFR